MKKFLLTMVALVGLTGAFSGCSKDEPNKPTKKEEINKAPIITSIDFEKTTFALNQVAIVKATVTDPENDPISLSWSSGTADFGKGQELELRFASAGEKEITLKATDTKGNAATKSSRINVIDPDFGFALWGDKLGIIKRSETGTYLGDNAGVIYHFLGNGYDRYYTFDNDILVSGIQERVYTPKALQATQYAIAWTLYEEEAIRPLWTTDINHIFSSTNGQQVRRRTCFDKWCWNRSQVLINKNESNTNRLQKGDNNSVL